MSNSNIIPQKNLKSAPPGLSPQLSFQNQYVSADEITSLAIEKYKTKGGRGITYSDLIERGLASDKRHAQNMLKYHFRRKTLFTLGNNRPQQYYPNEIESDILERKLQKSTPIEPSGVASSPSPPLQSSYTYGTRRSITIIYY
jgi:hypothetical protein